MSIPVRCFTCGFILGDKFRYYLEQVIKYKVDNNINETVSYYSVDMLDKPIQKSAEGIILDRLKITNECCRRHMLTQPK